MSKTLRRILFLSLSASSLLACAGGEPVDQTDYDLLPPLANVDELFHGAPKADEIPRIEKKSDEILPASHSTLLNFQSPVQSQGRRGVCSIFSTVGLMEHLYVKEGTLKNPDFSEQFLQWSAKFEVKSFPKSSGSNAYYNLEAINRFGIVDEATYPYEIDEWGSTEDSACNGEDDQPTRCYTNGHPSDEIKTATRYKLPRGRWLHNGDIKTHIKQEETGVVVGLTFFYQSWNHRASKLPVSSDSWNQGYVIYPSDKDEELSLVERAGHSILLIGWEDEQEMPVLDEEGQPLLDDNGKPVVEKGCYIFKNSWGTSGFGLDSKWGPGYGCISYRYVEEHGRARVSALPTVMVAEICDDGVDNDKNMLTDCEDSACSEDAACQSTGTELTFEENTRIEIPDNNPVGASSTITVSDAGTLKNLKVELDIEHTYKGDLRVTLYRGSDAIVLHNKTGGSADNLVLDINVDDWNGSDVAGEYRLVIVDTANRDTGSLKSWKLTATVE